MHTSATRGSCRASEGGRVRRRWPVVRGLVGRSVGWSPPAARQHASPPASSPPAAQPARQPAPTRAKHRKAIRLPSPGDPGPSVRCATCDSLTTPLHSRHRARPHGLLCSGTYMYMYMLPTLCLLTPTLPYMHAHSALLALQRGPLQPITHRHIALPPPAALPAQHRTSCTPACCVRLIASCSIRPGADPTWADI